MHGNCWRAVHVPDSAEEITLSADEFSEAAVVSAGGGDVTESVYSGNTGIISAGEVLLNVRADGGDGKVELFAAGEAGG